MLQAAYLLIADCELALRLLVLLGELQEALDRRVVGQDMCSELAIGLGVFMARLVSLSVWVPCF